MLVNMPCHYDVHYYQIKYTHTHLQLIKVERLMNIVRVGNRPAVNFVVIYLRDV